MANSKLERDLKSSLQHQDDGIVDLPGWQSVPVEPTEEMIRASYSDKSDGSLASERVRIYKAMLAAAPKLRC